MWNLICKYIWNANNDNLQLAELPFYVQLRFPSVYPDIYVGTEEVESTKAESSWYNRLFSLYKYLLGVIHFSNLV